MALAGVALIAFPTAILGLYTGDRAVIAAGIPLLACAAAFQLFDGTQVVLTGALRGLGDTHTPFLANIVGYWVLGLPIGAALCFLLGWGVTGIWIGLSLGLMTVALILLRRWHLSSRV
jgi:MATE family multidrug resistance protein